MQNPVISLVWLFGNIQLLAPLISLMIDTKPFCMSPLRTKPMLILMISYIILSVLAVLVRSEQYGNPLGLFDFSQSFRLQFAGQCLGAILFYATWVNLFRRGMVRYKRRRLSPI